MLLLITRVLLQVVTVFFGSGLDSYLLQSLFKVDNTNGEANVKNIKQRQPFKVPKCLQCFSWLGKKSSIQSMKKRGIVRF